MSDLTAVKIRGKRNRKPEEKWHYGKKRKAVIVGRSLSNTDNSSQASLAASTRLPGRRRRCEPEFSRLEELPTEILQLIFEYSANVDLALTSPHISSQLANAHLYDEITDHVLEPFLGQTVRPTAEQLNIANRLLESRFFTWHYFRHWLDRQLATRESLRGISRTKHRMSEDTFYSRAWKRVTMNVEGSILPPSKLLRPPFTEQKVQLFQVLMLLPWTPRFQVGPSYVEAVKSAMRYAGATNESKMMEICMEGFNDLISFEPQLLRILVLEGSCEVNIMKTLVAHFLFHVPQRTDIDWLDPELWSWAARAKKMGDSKGEWLMQVLRDASALSVVTHVDHAERKVEWERKWNDALKLLH